MHKQYHNFSQNTGQLNCPSGYDESEEECGTARRLLELPGGLFTLLGFIAACITTLLIGLIFALVRKKRKTTSTKHLNGGLGVGGVGLNGLAGVGGGYGGSVGGGMMNGTLHSDYKKDALFHDPDS